MICPAGKKETHPKEALRKKVMTKAVRVNNPHSF